MTTLRTLLVERDLASDADVRAADAHRLVHGGDLGTALLELGVVTERVLIGLQAEELGLRAGPSGELAPAPLRLLALVSGSLAARHELYPLEEHDGVLQVAVSQPLPPALENNLGFALGLGIEPLIVPAVRVRQAIMRDYGIPADRRMLRLIALLEGRPTPPPPAPPERGLDEGTMLVNLDAVDGAELAEDSPRLAGSQERPADVSDRPARVGDLPGASAPPPTMHIPMTSVEQIERQMSGWVEEAYPRTKTLPGFASVGPPLPPIPQLVRLSRVAIDPSLSRPPPDDPSFDSEWEAPAAESLPPMPASMTKSGAPSASDAADRRVLEEDEASAAVTVFRINPSTAARPVAAGAAARGPEEDEASAAVTLFRPDVSSRMAAAVERAVSETESSGAELRVPPLELPSPPVHTGPPADFVTEAASVTLAQVERQRRARSSLRSGRALAGWARRAAGQQAGTASHPPAARVRGPVTPAAAETALETVRTPLAALGVLFDFARQYFEYSALFAVHGDLAEGMDAFGPGTARDRVAGIGVPLDLPSILATARDGGAPVLAPLAREGLDRVLANDLGRAAERAVLVVPVVVRGRSVALLYGDHGSDAVEYAAIGEVIGFVSLVSAVIERLVVRRKVARGSGPVRMLEGNRGESFSVAPPASVMPRSPAPTPVATPVPPPPPVAAPAAPASPASAPAAPAATALAGAAVAMRSAAPVSARMPPGLPVPPAPPASSQRVPTLPGQRTPTPPLPSANTLPAPRADTLPAQPAPAPVEVKRRPAPPPPRPTPTARRVEPSAVPPRVVADAPAITVSAGEDPDGIDEMLTDEDDSPGPHTAETSVISISPHAPPARQTASPALPPVLIQAELVDRVIAGGRSGERALSEILSLGEAAIPAVFARFPGPITIDPVDVETGHLPAGTAGPVLGIVASMRRLALPFLAVRSADGDPKVRFWSVSLLGELHYRDAALALVPRLFDESRSVRRVAVRGLRGIVDDPEAAAAIREELLRILQSSDQGEDRRLLALHFVLDFGFRAAIPRLARLLEDPLPSVAAAVHDSLRVLSGDDLGRDPSRWLKWWETTGRDAHATGDPSRPAPRRTPSV